MYINPASACFHSTFFFVKVMSTYKFVLLKNASMLPDGLRDVEGGMCSVLSSEETPASIAELPASELTLPINFEDL